MKRLSLNLQNLLFFALKVTVGILLIVNPTSFTVTIISIAGCAFLLMSIIEIVKYLRTRKESDDKATLITGIVYAIVGLILVLGASRFVKLFSVIAILYALIIGAGALFQIKLSFEMKKSAHSRWLIQLLSGAILLVIAIVILLDPFKSTEMLWRFSGISLIVAAVLDIVVLFLNNGGKKSGK